MHCSFAQYLKAQKAWCKVNGLCQMAEGAKEHCLRRTHRMITSRSQCRSASNSSTLFCLLATHPRFSEKPLYPIRNRRRPIRSSRARRRSSGLTVSPSRKDHDAFARPPTRSLWRNRSFSLLITDIPIEEVSLFSFDQLLSTRLVCNEPRRGCKDRADAAPQVSTPADDAAVLRGSGAAGRARVAQLRGGSCASRSCRWRNHSTRSIPSGFRQKRHDRCARCSMPASLRRMKMCLCSVNPGSGKTHMLQAISQELVRRGHRMLFTSCEMLVQQLRIAKRDLKLSA
jgi:IstB-like ATP binding protein